MSAEFLIDLFWSDDSRTQGTILVVLAVCAAALILVVLPYCIRLYRLRQLIHVARKLKADSPENRQKAATELGVRFGKHGLASTWHDFAKRWESARPDNRKSASLARLADVFHARPLMPPGVRRLILPALPGLFLAIGIFGTFVGLTTGVDEISKSRDAPIESSASVEKSQAAESGKGSELQRTPRDDQMELEKAIGLAFRTSLWGLFFSMGFMLIGRFIEGKFELYEYELDDVVTKIFPHVTSEEMVAYTHKSRIESDGLLRNELTNVTTELSEIMETGLASIEKSTSEAASLVSNQQKDALVGIVEQLSTTIQEGVGSHLEELHQTIEITAAQQKLTLEGLEKAFIGMRETAQANERVTQTLKSAAESVDGAASQLRETATGFEPVTRDLKSAGTALQASAAAIRETQEQANETVLAIGQALETAQQSLESQRTFVEKALAEIRGGIERLSTGLSDDLSNALGSIDAILAEALGRLSGTIQEVNETIDRMATPMGKMEDAAEEIPKRLAGIDASLVEIPSRIGTSLDPIQAAVQILREGVERSNQVESQVSASIGRFTESIGRITEQLSALPDFQATLVKLTAALEKKKLPSAPLTQPKQRPPPSVTPAPGDMKPVAHLPHEDAKSIEKDISESAESSSTAAAKVEPKMPKNNRSNKKRGWHFPWGSKK